jgi:hypothetical protein
MSLLRRLVFLAIFLAILALAGEFVARKLLGDAVKSAVVARIGGHTSVSFGSTPLLLQLVHGQLDDVTVSSTAAKIGDLPPLALSASLRDVHLTSVTGLQGAIGEVVIHAHLGSLGVRDLLATPSCIASLPAGVLGALTTRPRVAIHTGQIDLLPPRGRAVELRLVPRGVSGAVYFALAGLDIAGRRAAPGELAAVGSHAACVHGLGSLPFGLHLQHVAAEPHNLEIELVARGSSFSALG